MGPGTVMYIGVGHRRGIKLMRHAGGASIRLLTYSRAENGIDWETMEREGWVGQEMMPIVLAAVYLFDEQSGRLVGVTDDRNPEIVVAEFI